MTDDNGGAFRVMWFPYNGTTYSTNGLAEDTWSEWSDAKHSIQHDTDWWTTNDATFELTGVQLEVGSQATPFEHRSYGEELTLCNRYYYTQASAYFPSPMSMQFQFPSIMRTAPTITHSHSGSPTINNITTHGFMGYNSGNTIAAYVAAAEL